MKKTSTLGIIAIAALLIALVLTSDLRRGAVGRRRQRRAARPRRLAQAADGDLHFPRRRAVLPVAGAAGLLVPEQGAGRRPGRAAGAVQLHQHRAQVVLQAQPAVLGGPGAAIGRCQQLLHPQRPRADQRGAVRLSGLVPGRQTAGAPVGHPAGVTHGFRRARRASTSASISSAMSCGARPSG